MQIQMCCFIGKAPLPVDDCWWEETEDGSVILLAKTDFGVQPIMGFNCWETFEAFKSYLATINEVSPTPLPDFLKDFKGR